MKAGGHLNVGSVIRRSYAILLGNLSAFFFVTLGATSPLYILYFWLGFDLGLGPSGDATDTLLRSVMAGVLAGSLASVLAVVAAGFIVYGTLRELQGQPASLGELLRHGLATLAPVLVVAVLSTAIVYLGLAAVVIPGLVLSVMFWVAVPVVVIERRSALASLRRSSDLTRGYRWPIFGLLMLSLAIYAGFGYLFAVFLDYETNYLRSLIFEWGFTVALDAFFAVLATVTYFDLKRIKEGGDIDQIAAVFD